MRNIASFNQHREYSEKIENILSPLRNHFSIDNFFYIELFPKLKKALFLTNQYSVLEKVVEIGEFSDEHNNVLKQADYNSYRKFLWPEASGSVIAQMLKEFGNIKSGVTLLSHSETFIKSIGFASTKTSNKILDVFLNHEKLLHHFIKYFEGELINILANKDKYLIDFAPNTVSNQSLNFIEVIDDCVAQMPIKKLFISDTNNKLKVCLTRKEYICLHLLCGGLSIKQIAWQLRISTRTVEEHIENSKVKFNVYNKFDLIRKALSIGIDKLYVS